MIERVYERVVASSVFEEVLIATDDLRIEKEANRIGAAVVLTDESHPSGTDRCLEAFQKFGEPYNVVVNVQGDEPFVDFEMLQNLCQLFDDESVEIGTAVRPFDKDADLNDPNKVKAILYPSGKVHSFSRKKIAIPNTNKFQEKHFKHIGVYAFRTETLVEICALKPSPAEISERLEQLRWMDNDYPIHAVVTSSENPSVDTPEDLKRLLKWMKENEIA